MHADIGHNLDSFLFRRLKVRPIAQVVQEALDKPRNIHFKGVTDLVTDTDRASEDAILKVSFLPLCILCTVQQACSGTQVRMHVHMTGQGTAETDHIPIRQYCKMKCHLRCFKRRCQTMASLVRKVVCLVMQTLNTCGA